MTLKRAKGSYQSRQGEKWQQAEEEIRIRGEYIVILQEAVCTFMEIPQDSYRLCLQRETGLSGKIMRPAETERGHCI